MIDATDVIDAIDVEEARKSSLAGWLMEMTDASDLRVLALNKLSGGAIQENWGLSVWAADGKFAGVHEWVLRSDAPSGVASSLSRWQEYALLLAAHKAGVTVPKPLFSCAEADVIGKPFYIMDRLPGQAEGHLLVDDPAVIAQGDGLAERLGRELARIHSIRPPRKDLYFLPEPDEAPALVRIRTYRKYLEAVSEPRPALEWVLRWAERNAPESRDIVLCHSDFRTGNYMVDKGLLTGILDWEFAAWSDPMEDIGWFCYCYWRFGADDREAGGIGSREGFYRGYEAEAGRPVRRDLIPYWEVMAAIRWGVIALQQGERYFSGGEKSLELLLIGMRTPETEMDALTAIREIEAARGS